MLNLQGAGANVNLKISDISEAMLRDVPEALVDLIEIATYVYAADQGTTRGGPADGGAAWRRRFEFHVPVRRPELWSRPEVGEALVDLLSFLSDDDYSFAFSKLADPPSVQLYFETLKGRWTADEVLLFSGGLDSLAGAIQEAIVDKRRVALISHDSASKRRPQLVELAAEVAQRAGPGRVRHIPVWATKAQAVGREFTQRSRSFLYATLAATVAVMLGRDRVRFYENGVTSLNLPIAPQVVGGRATRTTHPQSIRGFGRLFSAVLDRPFTVESPFLWKTKTDVVRLIADNGCASLVARSVSCSRTVEATKLHTHCGRCSQCIDRRFATLAAGLSEEDDPSEMYKVDLLTGERPFGETRAMAESFLQRANRLRAIRDLDFFVEYPEVSRSLRHVGLSSDEAAQRIVELHRRHAEEVSAALGGVAAGFPKVNGALKGFYRREDRDQERVEEAVYDINGDGLPDYIEKHGGTVGSEIWDVYYNIGGTLQAYATPWDVPSRCDGRKGVSLSREDNGTTRTLRDLIDINGDGLLDLIDVCSEGGVSQPVTLAYLNRGTHFASASTPMQLGSSYHALQSSEQCDTNNICTTNVIVDLDGDGLPDHLEPDFEATGYDHRRRLNLAGAWAASWCGQQSEPEFPDEYQYWLDHAPRPCVEARPGAARPGYLIHIENGIGGSTDLSYRPSDPALSATGGIPQMPMIVWTLAGIQQSSGMTATPGSHVLSTSISYQNGKYDYRSREFRGFGTVFTTDGLGTQRTTTFYQDAALSGKVLETAVHPPGADPTDEDSAYQLTKDIWRCAMPGDPFSDVSCPDTLDPGERRWVRLSASHRYDRGTGGSLVKHSYTRNFLWDAYGNILSTGVYGDDTAWALTQAEFIHKDSDGVYIVNKPRRVTVSSGGFLLEERNLFYDDMPSGLALGNVTRIESKIVPAPIGITTPTCSIGGGACSRTDTSYDAWGNVERVREYVTSSIFRDSISEYGDAAKLYPTASVNAEQHRVTMTYDAGCGKQTSQSLPNSTEAAYTGLDEFCRVSATVRPGQSPFYPDRQYSYFLGSRGVATEILTAIATGGVTEPYNLRHDLFDGLGRPIQSFRTASIDGARTTVAENTLTYDPQGNVVATAVPVERAVIVENGVARYQPIDAPVTVVIYDAVGRVKETISPANEHATVDYSQPWKVVSYDACYNSPDCLGSKTVNVVDAHGRTIETRSYEEGKESVEQVMAGTRLLRDGAGRVLSTKQWKENGFADSTEVKTTYDTLGRKIREEDPDSGIGTPGVWSYGYDAVGNLLFQEDPEPNQHLQFCYDKLNRVVSKHVRATNYSAHECSVDEATDTRYFYDSGAGIYSTGHLIAVRYPDGERLVENIDKAGRVTRSSSSVKVNDELLRAPFDFTFDYVGNPTSVTYPDGERVEFDYDDARALNFVKSDDDTRPLLANQTYDLNGRPRQTTHGNGPNGLGVVEERDYDDAAHLFRLEAIRVTPPAGASGAPPCGTQGQLLNLSYGYRPGGQIASIGDGLAAFNPTCISLSNAARYKYDGLGRLQEVSGNNFLNDAFEYDDVGNLTLIQGKTLEYLPSKPHQLSRVNGIATEISHDANGNRKGKAGWSYEYDPEDRLIAIDGGLVTMAYDPEGTQIRKTTANDVTIYYGSLAEYRISGGSGVLTKYYFAGGRRLAMREDVGWIPFGPLTSLGSGALLARLDQAVRHAAERGDFDKGAVLLIGSAFLGLLLIRVPGERRTLGIVMRKGQAATVAAVVLVHSVALPVWGEGSGGCLNCGVPTATPRPPLSQPLHYHLDHLGSVQVLTDANGNAVEHIRYATHGTVRARVSSAMMRLSDSAQTRGFTGYEAETVSGLYYAGARYYDPSLGGFLTRDPVRRVGSPYLYSLGDPINRVDPNGEDPLLIAIVIGAVAGALASGIQAAVQGASLGEAIKAAAIGGAIGAVTAPIGYGLMQGISAGATAAIVDVGVKQTVEASITAIALTASVGQAMYGLSQGDYSGIIGLGVSIGMGIALAEGFAQVSPDGQGGSRQSPVTNVSSSTTDVEIRYQHTEQGIGVHSTVVVTDPLGMQYSYRGGPASVPDGALANSTASSGAIAGAGGDLGWGNLTAEAAPWRLSYDYGDSFASTTVFSTTGSPEGVLRTLGGFADAVNNAQIPYNPLTTNSNAFAHQAVTYLGIPRPAPPAAFRPLVQGWDTQLNVGSFGSI